MFSVSSPWLPIPLIVFSTISTIFAIIAFSLSLLNYCIEVVWITAIAILVTLGYHGTMITLAFREHSRRKSDAIFLTKTKQSKGPVHQYFSTAGIIWGFTLFACWVVAFGINTQVTANGKGNLSEEWVNHEWDLKIQIGSSVLLAFQSLLLLGMCVYNLVGRRRVGPEVLKNATARDPEKIDEKTFIRNLERTTGLTEGSRQSLASSRFSIDSIAPSKSRKNPKLKIHIPKPSWSIQGRLPLRKLALPSKYTR
ncbi:hypothetical protein L218DRAFT_1002248 [Marasmius fiardii PR-910]|nr:hypothetical protein L218DRAFT_1002248 [Marasmius fiardii PR-910]